MAAMKKINNKMVPQDPTEWVDTWEDVCEAYMMLENRETDEPAVLPYPNPTNDLQRYINGCHKAAITVHVMNDGKIPDWRDDKPKYWLWWRYKRVVSGISIYEFDYSFFNHDATGTRTPVGPRLCFNSLKRAEYAGMVLMPIFKEMFGPVK